MFSYAGPGVSLKRVSSAGGTPETLTSLAEGEVTHRWPQVLTVVKRCCIQATATRAFDDANLVVQPLPSGQPKVVLRGGSFGRYLPSGHLVYVSSGTLFAVPFDLDRLEVTGQPMPALERVKADAGAGDAQFAVSTTGTLVYVPGQSTSAGAPIHWMNQKGQTTRCGPCLRIGSKPGSRQMAAGCHEDYRRRLCHLGLRLGTRHAHSCDGGPWSWPVWTPDGHRIVFASRPAGQSTSNLYWQRADGTGDAERLTESKNLQLPRSWHPSGKFLAFFELTSKDNDDLMILPMEGDDARAGRPGSLPCS